MSNFLPKCYTRPPRATPKSTPDHGGLWEHDTGRVATATEVSGTLPDLLGPLLPLPLKQQDPTTRKSKSPVNH